MNTYCILDLKALLDLVMKVIILGGIPIRKLCGTNGGTSGGIKPILVQTLYLLVASYFESLRPYIIRTIADADFTHLLVKNNKASAFTFKVAETTLKSTEF